MNVMALQRNLFFSVTAVALLLVLIGVNIPLQAQLIILAVFVAVAGLPHGTLDPWIARQKGLWSQPMGLLVFIVCYLACVGATVMLWSVFPGACLLMFLVISAWHFGKDWQQDLSPVSCFAAGFIVLASPVVFHPEEVASMFQQLGTPAAATIAVKSAWVLLPLAGLIVCLETSRNFKQISGHTPIEIILLIVIAAMVSPLLYFLLYFCFQHSPRHMINHSHSMDLKFKLINVSLLTLATIVIGVIAFMSLQQFDFTARMLNVLFVGLAALTVPHMLLIDFTTLIGTTDE